MNRTFKIEKERYEEGQKIFEYSQLTVEEGINILVGCNGSGKSTLINTIKYDLEINHIPVIEYDNLHDGGPSSRQEAVLDQDFYKVAAMMSSSEGQNIGINIKSFESKFDEFMRTGEVKTKYSGLIDIFAKAAGVETNRITTKERWILFDAVDSGLSIDMVFIFKDMLQNAVDYFKKNDYHLFIVVAANSFELVKDMRCIDVITGKQISFEDYLDYRQFVLNSRVKIDNR